MQTRFIQANDLRFHIAEAGNPDAPLVVLLHGFPEFHYGWRKQIDVIAENGYYVVAPDQRGYNLSDKPRSIMDYDLDHLAADVVAIIKALGHDNAVVIGHDWGAAVAWWTAMFHPDSVSKLGILNVPHLAVMMQTLRGNPIQMLKSWYIVFFQLPWLPEWSVSIFDYWFSKQALVRSSAKGTFSDADLQQYRDAWAQPKAFRSMLNWYRATSRTLIRDREVRVTVPALIIWGEKDLFLHPQMARDSLNYCDNARLEMLPHASHWVQHEAAEDVNQLLLEFLGK